MLDTDRQRFARLFAGVMAYYRQEVTAFTQDLFWEALGAFSFEQVQAAFNRHAKDPERGQFAPKVADLVRVLAGTTTERAALAWGKCLEAMQRVGAYQDVVFDDPAIHAAVEDLGGWPKLCRTRMDNGDLGYVQHRFCQAHAAYTGRGEFDYPRRLHGDRSADSEYAKKGLPAPEPMFVGEPARCQLVLVHGKTVGKTLITHSGAVAARMLELQP